MWIQYTIYPGSPPTVGWYAYDTPDPRTRTQIGGAPNTPLGDFVEVIRNTAQWDQFQHTLRSEGLEEFLT